MTESAMWNARAAAALALAMGAAFVDARRRRIPNALVAAGLLAAFALSAADGHWWLFAGLLVGPLLYAWPGHIVGGGDVKLAAAIGALIGPVCGLGVLSVAVAIYYALPPRIFRPFAPCVFIGTATAFIIEVLPC